MKKGKLLLGLGFILAAVLIILDIAGVLVLLGAIGEVSVFSLVCGIILISYTLERLIKGKIAEIFLPLAVLFLIFEKNIAHVCGIEGGDIVSGWKVILIALLLHIGFELLFPHFNICKKTKRRTVERENRFNSSTVYIDCESFSPSTISNKLGKCAVHFRNVEKYQGGKTLTVTNELGSMSIAVPASWTIVVGVDNDKGSVSAPTQVNNGGPVLFINGENSLGSLDIHFV